MNEQQRFTREGASIAKYDYDDATVFVMDAGVSTDTSVDVVDGTAMIVVDGKQYDFDVPAGEAQAFMKNGVVGVEVDR